MIRLIAIHRLIAVLLLAFPLTARAKGWEEKKINGRGYVSVASMKDFYGFTKLARTGNTVTLENDKFRLNLRIGSQECLMNGVKFVCTYRVESPDGHAWISKMDLIKLIDPVLRPSFIPNAGAFNTVIIDPGHGGKDSGATNSLGTEASYNLKVATKLKAILEKEYGFKVIMTRDSNEYLSLQQRVDVANRTSQRAIFVSIHHNSGGSHARGIETFTLSPVGVAHYGAGLKASDFQARTGNHHDSANVALATAVHGTLLSTLKDKKTKKAYTLDRGIKRARFSVLSGVKHPSILVECGFMTHPYEARLINDEGYRNTVAKSIAYAIQKYRAVVGGPKGAVKQGPAARQ